VNKILITGNAGSGKTTFSKVLAKHIHLPRYGLDSIVWKSGWKKTSDEEKREKIQSLIDKDSWIIDGVSGQAFRAANVVYFLDISLRRCLFNILRRFLLNGFKTREGLPSNCPEYIGAIKAIQVALLYQRHTRPWILEMIKASPEKEIIWVTSHKDLRTPKPII
jgi:hypothetical protein